MSARALEDGYWQAYRDFYRWGAIVRGARAHPDVPSGLRHLAYAAGWKKFEPLWDLIIRARRVRTARLAAGAKCAGDRGGQLPDDLRSAGSGPVPFVPGRCHFRPAVHPAHRAGRTRYPRAASNGLSIAGAPDVRTRAGSGRFAPIQITAIRAEPDPFVSRAREATGM